MIYEYRIGLHEVNMLVVEPHSAFIITHSS